MHVTYVATNEEESQDEDNIDNGEESKLENVILLHTHASLDFVAIEGKKRHVYWSCRKINSLSSYRYSGHAFAFST